MLKLMGRYTDFCRPRVYAVNKVSTEALNLLLKSDWMRCSKSADTTPDGIILQ